MERNRQQIEFTEPSATKQSFKDEVNINNILKRYTQTGEIDLKPQALPFTDCTQAKSFSDMCSQISEAENYFMSLPAEVREEFDNDVIEFVDFMSDDNNLEEAYEMGILSKPEELPVESDVTLPATPLPVDSEKLSTGAPEAHHEA